MNFEERFWYSLVSLSSTQLFTWSFCMLNTMASLKYLGKLHAISLRKVLTMQSGNELCFAYCNVLIFLSFLLFSPSYVYVVKERGYGLGYSSPLKLQLRLRTGSNSAMEVTVTFIIRVFLHYSKAKCSLYKSKACNSV